MTSVNFSHNSQWLLTSSCDRTVRLWSPAHSDPLMVFSSVNHNFASELDSSAKVKVCVVYDWIDVLNYVSQGSLHQNQSWSDSLSWTFPVPATRLIFTYLSSRPFLVYQLKLPFSSFPVLFPQVSCFPPLCAGFPFSLRILNCPS